MTSPADAILACLATVAAERRRRARQPIWLERVHALKRYQQGRFAHTYADLLASPRYGGATRFFLDELYGPRDFSQRDAQFARVVPALVRLFPPEIVETVRTLAELHALSEVLDSEVARHLQAGDIDAGDYAAAWRAAGRVDQRQRQIALTLEVGAELDRYTRKPLLRHSLRMMRGPARVAGLTELQRFLEIGFDTFRAMRGAGEFLALIEARERSLMERLFAPGLDGAALGELP